MYIAQGAAGFDPDLAITNSLANFIAVQRGLGRSDKSIAADLLGAIGKTVPSNHPCAGLGGKNLCNEGHISAAFINAGLLEEKAPKKTGFSMKSALAVGALLVGAAFLAGE